MSACYFWKNGQVLVIPGEVSGLQADWEDCLDLFCVDTNTDELPMRYGQYRDIGWCYVAFCDFPKEFKTHLLLLGVS